jgi:hypothetical protein
MRCYPGLRQDGHCTPPHLEPSRNDFTVYTHVSARSQRARHAEKETAVNKPPIPCRTDCAKLRLHRDASDSFAVEVHTLQHRRCQQHSTSPQKAGHNTCEVKCVSEPLRANNTLNHSMHELKRYCGTVVAPAQRSRRSPRIEVP